MALQGDFADPPKDEDQEREWDAEIARRAAEVRANRTDAEWRSQVRRWCGGQMPKPYTIPMVTVGDLTLENDGIAENCIEQKPRKRGK